MKSREGIPVTHYDEQLKEEVVAFAKATSQKEARDRLAENFLRFSQTSLGCFGLSDQMWSTAASTNSSIGVDSSL